MSGGETANFKVIITLSTEEGELPDNDEVQELIFNQMSGDLDDETMLRCIAVGVLARYVEE